METTESLQPTRGIAFLASYMPRACGIATFTKDLSDAVARQASRHQPVIVAAMNDVEEGYNYPERVKFEVRQDYQIDYSRAADFLNFSGIGALSLQHEYGIFGGEWGSNILTLLRDLRRPVVVTCHTVLQNPDPVQKEVFTEIAARANKVVAMSQKAYGFLEDVYGVERDKIAIIPHGIHDVPFVDPNYYKDKFGVEGRRVLLTFGLLSRNKGIEHMIEALPRIVEKHPKTTYLVLGATHPAVVREEGESYRLGLQRRVRELGMEEHVLFHPRFVELDELLEYIGATDIFIAPYLNLDQITSGALSYATGAGKAVVSTPFWHAEELLADGRGRLVPPADSKALADEVLALLDDEVALNSMRKRAYTYCRGMVWSAVARNYMDLFDEVAGSVPRTVAVATAKRRPIAPTNLPAPKLDHLLRMSDDTGPAHHARYTVPVWSHGYRMDDAAGVLVAAVKYFDILGDPDAQRLSEVCTALLQTLIGDGRNVAAALDYARHPKGQATETDIAKALWALGYVAHRSPTSLAEPAIEMFQQLMNAAQFAEGRSAAYAVLGAANYLVRFPGAFQIKRFLSRQADTVIRFCSESGGGDGPPVHTDWIERWRHADWPMAAQATTLAADRLGDDRLREIARTLIAQAREVTSDGTVFVRPGPNPSGEETPLTAAVYIEALGAMYLITGEKELGHSIRAAADWFLGANKLGEPLYDFSTGGCHDALTASGVNRNQGTEATTWALLSFLTLHRLASATVPSDDDGEDLAESGGN
ncbi:MAG: glycosyltransferase family 4 protein [Candidatus Latescibacterota bacterium]|jgi:glycosyltransferase involved in cell wall biosynthesis